MHKYLTKLWWENNFSTDVHIFNKKGSKHLTSNPDKKLKSLHQSNALGVIYFFLQIWHSATNYQGLQQYKQTQVFPQQIFCVLTISAVQWNFPRVLRVQTAWHFITTRWLLRLHWWLKSNFVRQHKFVSQHGCYSLRDNSVYLNIQDFQVHSFL